MLPGRMRTMAGAEAEHAEIARGGCCRSAARGLLTSAVRRRLKLAARCSEYSTWECVHKQTTQQLQTLFCPVLSCPVLLCSALFCARLDSTATRPSPRAQPHRHGGRRKQ